jgi:prepilin-type N-terminal cleavage/methylation domain-containing protein/prepilin-type processing-associated H-X9-DG protein
MALPHTIKNRHVFQGFTLIELLVVISIVSLLISILLPALAGARKAARTIACASNTRSQVTAMLSYTADYQSHGPGYGQTLPLLFDNPASMASGSVLLDQLDDYVKMDSQIWHCPSDTIYYHDQYNQHFASFGGSNKATSYSNGMTRKKLTTFTWGETEDWRVELLPIKNEAWRVYDVSGKAITKASKQPMTADAAWWIYKIDDLWQVPHDGNTVNVSFLDGHVNRHEVKTTGYFWDMGPARIDW